jgi:hypothetical protein
MELGLEELGPDVVDVEDDLGAEEEFEGPCDQEEEVGRVAEVDDAEAVTAPRLPGEPPFAPEGGGVLAEEPEEAAGFVADPVSVDMDAVEMFVGCRVTAHLGADDDHFVAGVAEGAGLLPDATVQRHGEVFDEDEDGRFRHGFERHLPAEALVGRGELAEFGPAVDVEQAVFRGEHAGEIRESRRTSGTRRPDPEFRRRRRGRVGVGWRGGACGCR